MLWEGKSSKAARRAVPVEYQAKARIRLDFVVQAASLSALRSLPPGADFKELSGPLKGTYQLRIAGAYRIRFKWDGREATDIEARDFHDED